MDEPKEGHHCRFAGIRRDLNVGETLQKHLPDAMNLSPTQLICQSLGRFALLGWKRFGGSSSLRPGRKMQLFH